MFFSLARKFSKIFSSIHGLSLWPFIEKLFTCVAWVYFPWTRALPFFITYKKNYDFFIRFSYKRYNFKLALLALLTYTKWAGDNILRNKQILKVILLCSPFFSGAFFPLKKAYSCDFWRSVNIMVMLVLEGDHIIIIAS